MSPPIDIDGAEIQRATIDGEDVSEITIDGQQTAGFSIIPDSAVLHLDASALNLQDGDSVSTWSDLTSNGDFVSETSTASEPVFRSNQINSKPAVEFNESILAGQRDFIREVFFVAMNPTTGDNAAGQLENLAGDEFNGRVIRTVANGDSAYTGSTFVSDDNDFSKDGQMRIDGVSTNDYVDGQFHILNQVATADRLLSDIGFNKGNTDRFFTGFLAEILWYDRELSASERDSERNRLATKYGITL